MIDLNNIKQVHCIGIGGIGLSGIAHVLLSRGFIVTGSDMNQNDTVVHLMSEGAKIVLGHRAKNVEAIGADLARAIREYGMENQGNYFESEFNKEISI